MQKESAKYLTFRLGGDTYALEVGRVHEIMGIQQITAVPKAPAYVKGVIILRGTAIPVVDMRLKFGLPEREFTRRTCIIVVQTSGQLLIGLIVDRVSEVLTVNGSALKGKIKILPDVDKLLPVHERLGII